MGQFAPTYRVSGGRASREERPTIQTLEDWTLVEDDLEEI
jgi:hypothetical protein